MCHQITVAKRNSARGGRGGKHTKRIEIEIKIEYNKYENCTAQRRLRVKAARVAQLLRSCARDATSRLLSLCRRCLRAAFIHKNQVVKKQKQTLIFIYLCQFAANLRLFLCVCVWEGVCVCPLLLLLLLLLLHSRRRWIVTELSCSCFDCCCLFWTLFRNCNWINLYSFHLISALFMFHSFVYVLVALYYCCCSRER